MPSLLGSEMCIRVRYKADLNSGLISIASPIAKALIGKELGSSVEVSTPRGTKNYEILSIDIIK